MYTVDSLTEDMCYEGVWDDGRSTTYDTTSFQQDEQATFEQSDQLLQERPNIFAQFSNISHYVITLPTLAVFHTSYVRVYHKCKEVQNSMSYEGMCYAR
jgi:hypothetical protein